MASRTEILSNTLNRQFWETVDGTGNRLSFDSFESALAFATAREWSLVRTAVWNGATWDGGIPMDSIDSVNAQNGTYFIYKRSGDPSSLVAYFTLERLNAVIAEFAIASVNSFYWWQRIPSPTHEGNNLFNLTSDRTFVGSSVSLAAHANYLINGVPFSGLVFNIEGEHILTVFDDWGNSYLYTLVIVRTAPEIWFKVSGGDFNLADSGIRYAFRESVTLKIHSAFGADFAMLLIRNSAGELLAIVHHGDEFVLSSGRYFVTAINHAGLSPEIQFAISLNTPAVNFNDNQTTKRLEVRVQPSSDISATINEIRIYKSVDGGLSWVLLETDNYGRAITHDRFFYEFNLDGLYRVVVMDNFRSGIDAIIAEHAYLKPPPVGTLHGVIDGGYTNTSVRFTWTDEAQATVTFNGETSAYTSGTVLTEDGFYTITFTDTNGYVRLFTFTIKQAAPVVSLSVAPNNGYLTEPVTVTFEANSTARLYRDERFIGEFENAIVITEDGEYRIVVTDRASNITVVTFTLDATPPTAELVGVIDGGTVRGGSVIIRNLSKPATVAVYLNGSRISYTLGEALTELGSYRVVITDNAGNITEYTFDIAYAVNTAGVIIILIVVFGVIGGGIAVFLFRKRGKFKAKKT